MTDICSFRLRKMFCNFEYYLFFLGKVNDMLTHLQITVRYRDKYIKKCPDGSMNLFELESHRSYINDSEKSVRLNHFNKNIKQINEIEFISVYKMLSIK